MRWLGVTAAVLLVLGLAGCASEEAAPTPTLPERNGATETAAETPDTVDVSELSEDELLETAVATYESYLQMGLDVLRNDASITDLESLTAPSMRETTDWIDSQSQTHTWTVEGAYQVLDAELTNHETIDNQARIQFIACQDASSLNVVNENGEQLRDEDQPIAWPIVVIVNNDSGTFQVESVDPLEGDLRC